jgi:hypothetical protein
MKKWLLFLVVIGLISSIYILIPRKLVIAKTILGKCNISAASRSFLDTSQWKKWWPENQKNIIPGGFIYNGCTYKIEKIFYNDVSLLITCADDSSIASSFHIASLSNDSILIGWDCKTETSNNPLKKLKEYQHAKLIKKNMDTILNVFKTFIEDDKNIYSVGFRHDLSNDSTLITMSVIADNYPGTTEIYKLINTLKKYAADYGAKEINYPMLNISKLNNSQYKAMVALSLNKTLPGNNKIIIKRFVPWKMIEGEVCGGIYSIDKAFEQLYNFKSDYGVSFMAIPFQLLITDRSKESDTTKWITKICVPVPK